MNYTFTYLHNELYIKEIEIQIAEIENDISNTTDSNLLHNLSQKLSKAKSKYDMYYEKKAKGAQIRSKSKWVEQGEKNTKYFLSLENKHQTNNRIISIKNRNGRSMHETVDILKETVDFYQSLYSAQDINIEEIEDYLNNITNIETLSPEESLICEHEVSIEECSSVINKMGKNKSPGYDGLPSEFYKVFWDDIKEIVVGVRNVVDMYNSVLSNDHRPLRAYDQRPLSSMPD